MRVYPGGSAFAPMHQRPVRSEGRGMNTLWTVISIASVVATLAVVLWALVVAPFSLPEQAGKP